MPRKIEISHKTIIFIILFLIFLWFLYVVRDIILQFFVALLIMTILNPFVSRLSRHRIPRGVSILLSYILIFSIISLSIAALVPPLIEQTSAFANSLPRFINNLGISSVLSDQLTQQLVSQLASVPAKLVTLTLSLFSNVIGVVAVLVFTFYLLSDREKVSNQLGLFVGENKNKEITRLINILEGRLGGWARGQLGLMLVIAFANYIGLSLLGIPYALPLSILAGLLEIIPYIGPIIAAIPAVVIGFGTSPILGMAVAAMAFLIQQLENYVFVPKIMQKSAGVNPIITLLALAIGFRLAGVIGLLISVPFYIIFQVLANEYILKK